MIHNAFYESTTMIKTIMLHRQNARKLMAPSKVVVGNVTVTEKKLPVTLIFGCYRYIYFASEVYLFTSHCPFSGPGTGCADAKHGIDDEIIARPL